MPTSDEAVSSPQDNNKRETWSYKIEFILSCIGLSVGIGNVWRYPYVAYENGGGTFQIPYILMSVFVGYPLYYLEIARGQYSQRGTIAVWHSCPAAVGVGWGMVFAVLFGITYYNVIIAYTMLYMALSFTSELPWQSCNSWWGADDNCYVRTKESAMNEFNYSASPCDRNTSLDFPETSSKQFWEKFVLNIGKADGIEDINGPQWRLVLVLAATWICIFFSVYKGIKTSGKVVYVTATLPFIILLALLIQCFLLDGSIDGLEFFFSPKWDKLLEIKVWYAAAQQMTYSLGLGNGALISLASFNRFHNKVNRDALQLVCVDYLTSVMASTVVFMAIGSLAKGLHVQMDKIFAGGQGLAFIIFPEIVTFLPVPQLWCFMFFLMLFTLGIDSTFASIEALWTAVLDDRPKLKRHQTLLYFVSCVIFFGLGLIYCTAGGQYVLNLVDSYSIMGRTLIIAWEVIAVSWIYGLDKFCDDITLMLGFRPNIFLRICWKYVCPIAIIILTIAAWAMFTPTKYGCYHYPIWAHVIGWCIGMIIMLQPIAWALYEVFKHWKKGNWYAAFQPNENWILQEKINISSSKSLTDPTSESINEETAF